MDPKVCGKILTTHWRGYGVDVEALRGGFPLRQNAGDGSRWDLADTKGYGGGNCDSGAPWMFSGYVGLYKSKKYVGGRPMGPEDGECKPRISRVVHEGGGRAHPYRARPLSRGPLGRPPTYFLLLYIPTYPENIQAASE